MATNKYKPMLVQNHWLVCNRAGTKFLSKYAPKSEQEAKGMCLLQEGHELLARLSEIQEQLEDGGFVDPKDPFGWKC